MATEGESQDQFFAGARAIIARVMQDGTVAAASREAVKDVRNTLHEVFFGRPEQGGELGAPMNPLASDIAAARDEAADRVPSPSEIARDDRPMPAEVEPSIDYGQERGR